MYFPLVAVSAFLAGLAMAKTCVNTTVTVSLSARQGVFNIAIPQANLQVTDFVLNVTQQGRNFTNLTLTGYDTTAGKYKISTTFCKPSNDYSKNPTVQVLTHGIGFDKAYWDYPYDGGKYSYVDVATDQYKYSTLSYDRLGVGASSHGDPLNEIQAFLEVAALYQLTQMLRSGTFPGVNHAFKKVVHVGHSFGSAQTYALANLYPSITDGIVLTGYTMSLAYLGLFPGGANFVLANLADPHRLGSYPDGYLVFNDDLATKFLLFKPNYFDNGILEYLQGTAQPVTLGEILTLASLTPTNNFAGPVLAITGDADLPYCGCNCFSTGNPTESSIPAELAANFPNVPAGDFEAYVQPNMGHAINLHFNATGAYAVINNFLGSKGLGSS